MLKNNILSCFTMLVISIGSVNMFCLQNNSNTVIIEEKQAITIPDTVYTNWDFYVKPNRCYIADWDLLKITVLDSLSKLVRTIPLRKGQGPGELFWPLNLTVDSGRIFILHGFGRKVSYFDTLGVYVGGFKVRINALGLHVAKDKIYLIGMEINNDKVDICHEYNLHGEYIASYTPCFKPDETNRKKLETVGLTRMLLSSYFFEGDTLWLISQFENEIKAYHKNREIMTISGADGVVAPPELIIRANGKDATIIPIINTQINIAVDDKFVYITAWNSVAMKHFFHIYNKNTGEIVAQKVEAFSRSTAFEFYEYFNKFFYFYTKAGIREIKKSVVRVGSK